MLWPKRRRRCRSCSSSRTSRSSAAWRADAIVIGGGRVVHTGPARALLDDDDLTRRLLGVHAEQSPSTATEGDLV